VKSATAGRVVVAGRVENLRELYQAKRAKRPRRRVRSVEFSEAVVDTRATFLCLPTHLIGKLGLEYSGIRNIRTAAGLRETPRYDAVRLTIQGRACTVEVLEAPEDFPVVIGQVPLAMLDFVVDPKRQRLIGNPAHGGERMVDQF
jgi:predicted aspartyl protease